MNTPQPDNSSPQNAAQSGQGHEHVSASPSEQVEQWLDALRERAEALRGACSNSDAQYVLTLTGELAHASADVPADQVAHVGKHLERVALANDADVSALHEQIEDLITLCRRMSET